MHPPIYINLYGSLPKTVGHASGKVIKLSLNGPTPLADVLSTGRIPAEAIQLIMLNHKAANMDVVVQPGDRVALFPREYPFFVDWYDFRNRPKPTEKPNTEY